MGAIISDFRLLFHKFVPNNFLNAKNGPKSIIPDFSSFAFTQKSNNY